MFTIISFFVSPDNNDMLSVLCPQECIVTSDDYSRFVVNARVTVANEHFAHHQLTCPTQGHLMWYHHQACAIKLGNNDNSKHN